MSKSYYIYLDQRDVGKCDLWFYGWVNTSDEPPEYNDGPTPGESVPIFSFPGNRIVFDSKDMAERAAKQILKRFPEIEGQLHVELI